MLLKTLLNKIYKFKSFTYTKCSFETVRSKSKLVVSVVPRKNSKPICSVCGRSGPVYDTMKTPRCFEFIPVWGVAVFFLYAMRRVNCSHCGTPKTEQVPWADGKNQLTKPYRAFLAEWAEELSWKRVAERFNTSWQKVYHAVEWVVEWGLARRKLDNVTAIGVDEVAWQKGHNYLTLVYQLESGFRRLLWVGEKRTKKTLDTFFCTMNQLDKGFISRLKFICSDMWKPYLKVIKKRAPEALNILDRFHIVQHFNKSVDNVRREEVRRLKEEKKEPVLVKSRWCFLKKRGNLTEKQRFKLRDLLKINLKTVRAYLLKEQFQSFWEYKHPAWARKFLDSWCEAAIRSRIDPMKRMAAMLRKHRELILNWFRAKKQYNNGIVEGQNRLVNLTVRKAFGFRSKKIIEITLFHQLGKLPKPKFSHKLW